MNLIFLSTQQIIISVLDNYFSPLNPENIFLLAIIVLLLDVIGSWLHNTLKLPNSFRALDWLLGLSAYVFIWFCLHFFLPFDKQIAWAILLTISLYPLFSYIKNQEYKKLWQAYIGYPFAFIALLPLAKQMFFLLSKPPHRWDELNYHFYSPERLQSEINWSFLHQNPPYFFDMLPRFLSVGYVLLFSLTDTYATAQTVHLLLFLSSLTAAGLILKKRISLLPTILFTTACIYFYPELLQNATEGYVDAGLAGIFLLIIIYAAEYLFASSWEKLKPIVILIGMAISIKYTAIPFAMGLIIFLVASTKAKIFLVLNKKHLAVVFLLAFLTGGYWYLKNLLLTGNPIYPYTFPCINNYPCAKNAPDFLNQYTIAFNNNNFLQIINDLTFNNPSIFWLGIAGLFLTIILALFSKHSFIIKLSITGLVVTLIELIINSNISGYQNRFFYHWNIQLALYLFLPLTFISLKSKKRFAVLAIIVVLYGIFFNSIWQQFNKVYLAYSQQGYYTGEDILYAKQKINLTQWLAYRFPNDYKLATDLCSSPPSKTIFVVDKYSYNSQYDDFIRAFFANCQVVYLPQITTENTFDSTKLLTEYLINHPAENKYLFSLQTCNQPKIIEYEKSYYSIEIKAQQIISSYLCNLQTATYPYLYRIE